MRDAHDDLGDANPPQPKVIAVIPVLGRRQLVKHTVERLLKKNGCFKVICVGNDANDKKICVAAGAEWVTHMNKPLGDKWNRGFYEAKKYSPDACLFVGSSDWVSDNWVSEMTPHLKDYDLIGTPGCHFLHIGKGFKLCFWPGYTGWREGESIGIGRMISAELLDRLEWNPFLARLDNSMDGSMQERCLAAGGKSYMVRNEKIKSVSISTDVWENKHQFSDHINGTLPSEIIEDPFKWIENNFPEAIEVCASLKGT